MRITDWKMVMVQPAIFTHEGNANPTTESWAVDVYRSNVVWTAETDGDIDYWQAVDHGTGLAGYRGDLSSSQVSNAWTASCKLRVPAASTSAYAVSLYVRDGSEQWTLNFTHDEMYYQNQASAYIKISNIIHPDEFHIFQMYHDPSADGGSGAVSIYDNGYLKTTLTRADMIDNANAGLVRWGSVSSDATSTQQWNWAQFAAGNQVIDPIPPSGTVILIN